MKTVFVIACLLAVAFASFPAPKLNPSFDRYHIGRQSRNFKQEERSDNQDCSHVDSRLYFVNNTYSRGWVTPRFASMATVFEGLFSSGTLTGGQVSGSVKVNGIFLDNQLGML
jgi:hypothetical protein